MLTRHSHLLLAMLLLALVMAGKVTRASAGQPEVQGVAAVPLAKAAPPLLDELQRRTFYYFWDNVDPQTGLVPDRYPTPSVSSIAAVGFALTAYPIGAERGYVPRAGARERVLTTPRLLRADPQGSEPADRSGFNGFFYHYLDMRTGHRAGLSELSTVDTALLVGGMLFCQSYFDASDPDEAEIRRLVDEIYARVDWTWAQPR